MTFDKANIIRGTPIRRRMIAAHCLPCHSMTLNLLTEDPAPHVNIVLGAQQDVDGNFVFPNPVRVYLHHADIIAELVGFGARSQLQRFLDCRGPDILTGDIQNQGIHAAFLSRDGHGQWFGDAELATGIVKKMCEIPLPLKKLRAGCKAILDPDDQAEDQ